MWGAEMAQVSTFIYSNNLDGDKDIEMHQSHFNAITRIFLGEKKSRYIILQKNK